MINRTAIASFVCLMPFFSGGCLIAYRPHMDVESIAVDGRALDKQTGQPIPNVQVTRTRHGRDRTLSDKDGWFHLPVKERRHTLVTIGDEFPTDYAGFELRASGYRTTNVLYYPAQSDEGAYGDDACVKVDPRTHASTIDVRMTRGSESDPPINIEPRWVKPATSQAASSPDAPYR